MGRQTIGQRIAPTRPEPAPGHPAPNMRGGQSRALRGGPAPAHVETLPGPLGASQPRWAHSGLVPPTHPGSARRSARPPWRKSSRRLQGARPRSDLGGYFHFRGEGGRAGGGGAAAGAGPEAAAAILGAAETRRGACGCGALGRWALPRAALASAQGEGGGTETLRPSPCGARRYGVTLLPTCKRGS